jgi:hypothetical protein
MDTLMLANPNLRALIRITPMHLHGKQNMAQAANRVVRRAQLQNARFRVKMAQAALENLRELENHSAAAKD